MSDNLALSDTRVSEGMKAIDDYNAVASDNDGLDEVSSIKSLSKDTQSALSSTDNTPISLGGDNEEESEEVKTADTSSSSVKGNWSKPLAFKKEKILGGMDFLFDEGESNLAAGRGLASEDAAADGQEILGDVSDSDSASTSGYVGASQVNQNRNSSIFSVISLRYRKKFFMKKN